MYGVFFFVYGPYPQIVAAWEPFYLEIEDGDSLSRGGHQ
jgi:hypothetical protein